MFESKSEKWLLQVKHRWRGGEINRSKTSETGTLGDAGRTTLSQGSDPTDQLIHISTKSALKFCQCIYLTELYKYLLPGRVNAVATVRSQDSQSDPSSSSRGRHLGPEDRAPGRRK